MLENFELYIVEASTVFDDEVERFVKKKKYRQLPKQIEELINELKNGNFTGSLLTHNDELDYDLYKKRLTNKDTNSGKSNGYRVMYLVQQSNRYVGLLSIYYKKEMEKQSEAYIEGLIDGMLGKL